MEETAELGEVTAHSDRPGYEPISSTLWRQREDYCARLIQGAWRRRGGPGPGLPAEAVFGSSMLGSRTILDAVVEEDHDELSEELHENNFKGPTIVVHSRRSSSVSSTSIV